VGFWNKISGLFTGDTYYPGNQNREVRLKELSNDCQLYMAEIKDVAKKVKDEMANLNMDIRKYFPQGQDIPEELKLSTFLCEHIPFDEIASFFGPMLVIPVIGTAFLTAQTVLEAKDGNALAAGLTAALGISALYLSGGMFFGMMPVNFLAIGALKGSAKRNELQKLIPQAADARRKLYESLFINRSMFDLIKTFQSTIKAVENTIDDKSVLDILVLKLTQRLDEFVENLTASLDDAITKDLRKLDTNRNSWTHEG
jgi:hypothetical protein